MISAKTPVRLWVKIMMLVNHAGELGAVYIYRGQIKALGYKSDTQSLNIIKDMSEQEKIHLNHSVHDGANQAQF